LNSLVTASNQKSSRSPVVEYEQHTVQEALDALKKKGLMANVLGDGRALKYRHTIAVKYPLDPSEMTVLGLLFLRGPLTVGEIKNMAGRMYDFEDLAEVQTVLQNLVDAETTFIRQMERKTGQKEVRYFHLFADEPIFEEVEQNAANPNKINELEGRLSTLEEQVAAMQKIIDDLMN
jgi:uncharacterized protein YceH (UPF0502 family)